VGFKKVKIVKTAQKHIDFMKGNLREADLNEVWASSFSVGSVALQRSFNRSSSCWTALMGGEPFACFGVVPLSCLNLTGSPWMLATDRIDQVPFKVVRESKKYVNKMIRGFEKLENWIDERNTVSKRWLKWCGFVLEPPREYGAQSKLFHRFWKIKGN